MNNSKKSLSIILTAFSLFIALSFVVNRNVSANFEGYAGNCIQDGKNAENDAHVEEGGEGGGDWTVKGSNSYKNAKGIFYFLTKKMGFSGAGGAGAVAVANRESNFNPKAMNPGGGVAGVFQWSGWSNTVNGDRIHSGGFIKTERDLTLEKEMKLTQYELNHGYSKVKSTVGKANSPTKAADDWSLLYEGVAIGDPQTKPQMIHADAQKAYRVFGGANISANSALLGGMEAAEEGTNQQQLKNNPCQKQEIQNADGNIVKIAKSLLGYFSYYQSHGVRLIGSVDHPDKNGVTDCSGFVWLVLKKAGYKVPEDMGWFTMPMEEDAKASHHKWLKEISKDEAQPGDVVIVNVGSGAGSQGHTAILLSKWKGDNTKVSQMTGNGKGVSEGTFRNSFYSLLQIGSKPVIARPIKK